jgi:hypothetical protein
VCGGLAVVSASTAALFSRVRSGGRFSWSASFYTAAAPVWFSHYRSSSSFFFLALIFLEAGLAISVAPKESFFLWFYCLLSGRSSSLCRFPSCLRFGARFLLLSLSAQLSRSGAARAMQAHTDLEPSVPVPAQVAPPTRLRLTAAQIQFVSPTSASAYRFLNLRTSLCLLHA